MLKIIFAILAKKFYTRYIMKKLAALSILFILTYNSILFSQDWGKQGEVFFKQDNNIFYAVDTAINITDRESIITKTKEYIQKDLNILQERDLTESLLIALVRGRGDMYRFTDKRTSSFSILKNETLTAHTVISVYDPQYCSLNRELMRIILCIKWGNQQDSQLTWLNEGLSTYATPEADNCNNYTLEEKYIYLLQNSRLIDLTEFPTSEISPDFKAARLQAAYIVSKLLHNYGIEKLKQLWIEGMNNFETIFGESLSAIMERIDIILNQRYNIPLTMNWQDFAKDCIDPQPDDWLPIYDNSLGQMMIKKIDNLTFILSSCIDIDKGDEIIEETKNYIKQNLELIDESGFKSFIQLALVQNRDEVEKVIGDRLGGMAQFSPKEGLHTIASVYSETSSVLKHEVMHAVSIEKWGEPGANLLWLSEGLAVFAAPETEECTGYTLEERYVYLLQSNNILSIHDLIAFPWTRTSYSQAGYIVKYLIEKYGIKKLKSLWQNGIDTFECIYGQSFEEMISSINAQLNDKYPNPIGLNWNVFNTDCIKNIDLP